MPVFSLISLIIPEKRTRNIHLSTYSIVAENNAGQYYPDYTYNPQGINLYSESKISSFINRIPRDLCIAFQNE